MELSSGFKRTSVGPIPVDWEEVLIGDLMTFKNGLNKAKHYFGRGTPIVNYMDVFERPVLRMSSLVGRVEVDRRELRAYEVRKGDLFFTRTSETVEEIGVAAVMLDDALDTVYSGFVLRGRPTDRRLDDMFKAYCFTPRYVREQITSRASYTTRALTNGRALSATALALPRLDEQRRIAAVLTDVDALLNGLTHLIAKKRDLKQAAMQQLLTGRTRLPGFREQWSVSTVGSEFDVQLGKMLDSEKNAGVSKPYLGNSAVQWGRIDTSDLPTMKMSARDIERFRLEKGDLLVCEGGEVGRAAIWDAEVEECYYQKALHRLRPKGRFNVRFMAALLALWSECGTLTSYVTQTSIAHLPRDRFVTIPLPVPSAEEQDAIATILSDMDAELTALEARRAKTQALKQAMMQSLLTGRIRLVTPEAAHA